MNRKRLLIVSAAAYIVVILVVSVVYLVKGEPNYLTYKNQIQSIEAKEAAEEKEAVKEPEEKAVEVIKEVEENKETVTPPPPENTYEAVEFTRMIKVGLQGDDVKRVQFLLKKKNLYTGEITGNFDELTKTGVKEFQTANGLDADGIVGSGTWAKLNE